MFYHIDKKQPNFTKINMTNISGIFTQSYSRAKVYYLQLVWSVVRKKGVSLFMNFLLKCQVLDYYGIKLDFLDFKIIRQINSIKFIHLWVKVHSPLAKARARLLSDEVMRKFNMPLHWVMAKVKINIGRTCFYLGKWNFHLAETSTRDIIHPGQSKLTSLKNFTEHKCHLVRWKFQETSTSIRSGIR